MPQFMNGILHRSVVYEVIVKRFIFTPLIFVVLRDVHLQVRIVRGMKMECFGVLRVRGKVAGIAQLVGKLERMILQMGCSHAGHSGTQNVSDVNSVGN
jgi:hypothetical protein